MRKNKVRRQDITGRNIELPVGRALSLALRLRNKNKGANHTHMPKKVAISVNPGTLGYAGDRYVLCLASWVILEK